MLTFSKMHGLGNDFVMIDRRQASVSLNEAQIRWICDRHFGVGCDLLCFIDRSASAAARLSFFNADGSEAQACGNATRCAARLIGGDVVEMEGPVGPLRVERPKEGIFSINMGQPQTQWDQIPLASQVETSALPGESAYSAVGIGNPHLVVHVENAEEIDPAQQGPSLEHHPLFPQRTNVEFVSLVAEDTLRMRVWERGCGVTQACGSGACASVVAFHRKGLIGKRATVHLDGGALDIDWRDDGIWMTGPATHVFDGTISAEQLKAAAS